MVSIGYACCEAFDVILYIARTITKLNNRVLIVDLSETGALTKAIKHGMDLDSREGIVNYRDINYIRREPSAQELEMFDNGVVFVVYGRNYKQDFRLNLKYLNIVVNTFPNILEEMTPIIHNAAKYEDSLGLLIRDIVTLDDVDRVKDSLALPPKVADIDYLYFDLADYENAVECQISQVARFTRVSARMEKYIVNQVLRIIPKIKEAKVKKAVKAARKGV